MMVLASIYIQYVGSNLIEIGTATPPCGLGLRRMHFKLRLCIALGRYQRHCFVGLTRISEDKRGGKTSS
jgi:hypothetical protein